LLCYYIIVIVLLCYCYYNYIAKFFFFFLLCINGGASVVIYSNSCVQFLFKNRSKKKKKNESKKNLTIIIQIVRSPRIGGNGGDSGSSKNESTISTTTATTVTSTSALTPTPTSTTTTRLSVSSPIEKSKSTEPTLVPEEKEMTASELLMHRFADAGVNDYRLSPDAKMQKMGLVMGELSDDIGEVMDKWLYKSKVRADRKKSKALVYQVRQLIGHFGVAANQLKQTEESYQNDMRFQ
ncbi:hypothetical protein RFI_30562, partial [Reticulomyxa filosa]